MNIALIAHDKKKELMSAFCIAYKGIFEKHNLYATGTTGAILAEASGLNIQTFSPGVLGEQQISARVSYNEIDLVIFLRDPSIDPSQEPQLGSLIKMCDSNNIPFATNAATAEVLIRGLERGDLDWRELIK